MYKLINLTPHAIVIAADGNVETALTIPPSGMVARVSSSQKDTGAISVVTDNETTSVVLAIRTWGEVLDLPAPADNTIYIVSALVAGQVSDRSDVYAPDTGKDALRNDKGHIVAVRRLILG